MDSVSVNKFRDNLKSFVEQVVTGHLPLKVTRRSGEDFIVVSAEDWEREQETLYVFAKQRFNAASCGINGDPCKWKRVYTYCRGAG